MAIFKKQKQPTDPAGIAESQRQQELKEVDQAFQKGITALRDFIAPSSIEFSSKYFQIGTRYASTYYVYAYPRQIYTGWISQLINIDEVVDLSIFIYP